MRTFGCQMNEHDSERIAGLLEADGLVAATDLDDADVVVLNTCCIRENADNKLYGNLGHLKTWKGAARRPPDRRVRLPRPEGPRRWCGGGRSRRRRDGHAQRAPCGRAARTRPGPTGPVTEIFDAAVLDDHAMFPSALPAVRETSFNAWVTIQIGCDNSCAFCIVPAVRGVEISRPFDEIVAEVGELAAAGVTEITLLGQNVNSYGRDLQLAARRSGDVDARVRPLFADLLRAAGAVDGIRRVRFTSPHPKDMRPETFAAMAETPTVCPQLHYPLQSGSDAILAAMHRGYTAQRYLDRLAEARRVVPDLAVSTDIIVGFPGETDDDFAATLAVAAEARFDDAFTFIFSPRPGTEAATMSDRFVAPAVAGERFDRLRVVIERSSLAGNRARIGRTEEVLVEGPSKKDRTVLAARTAQHRLVHFASPAPLRPGTYVTVEITGAAPHHLTGELRDIVAAPAHRIRIPVAAH